MKVRKRVTRMIEVGEPDHVRLLPTASRRRLGFKTTCCICGLAIEDDWFAVVFKEGQPNRIAHQDCLENEGVKLLARLP